MNYKVIAIIFFSLTITSGSVIFYILPQTEKMFITLLSSMINQPLSELTILRLQSYFLKISLGLGSITLAIMAVAAYFSNRLLKPILTFVDQVKPLFSSNCDNENKNTSGNLNIAGNHVNIINSIPMGIMIINDDSTIQMFNKEASVIADLDSGKVIGSPLINFFSNKFYNKTMEVILSGKEHLGLRNILKVGGIFKEILFSISPLRNNGSITGAVVIFQDVTPQQKMVEVQAAYDISRDLATQKDLDSTVKVIASSAATMANAEYSAVFLTNKDGQLMVLSSYGMPDEAVKKYNASPAYVDNPIIKNIYSKMVPLLHGDVKNKPDLYPFLIVPGIKSMYSFPVIYSGKLIGMINLYSKEQNKLSKDTIYLIHSMSGQLNSAISNFYELQRNRALATLDGMTGLYNKTHFMELMKNKLTTATSQGGTFSVAIMDIDHFKNVNDTYGHQIGDRVLKEIAGIISINIREEDKACRFGGEEFSILMHNTPKAEAFELADRIRRIIESTAIKLPDNQPPLKITISGGVVNCPEDTIELEKLISFADIALYSAKRSGRNKIVGYTINQKM
ncbi:MAG: diguanylate cyclase [Peptococcaceae bacterium]|nr:diguanylate cyclase [Peptococcaceae bacterium]